MCQASGPYSNQLQQTLATSRGFCRCSTWQTANFVCHIQQVIEAPKCEGHSLHEFPPKDLLEQLDEEERKEEASRTKPQLGRHM